MIRNMSRKGEGCHRNAAFFVDEESRKPTLQRSIYMPTLSLIRQAKLRSPEVLHLQILQNELNRRCDFCDLRTPTKQDFFTPKTICFFAWQRL
jgi:hypothetical protein